MAAASVRARKWDLGPASGGPGPCALCGSQRYLLTPLLASTAFPAGFLCLCRGGKGKWNPALPKQATGSWAAVTLRLVGQSSLHLEMFYCSKLKSLIILLQSRDPVEKTPSTFMTAAFSLKFPSNFRMPKQDPLFLNSAVMKSCISSEVFCLKSKGQSDSVLHELGVFVE